MLTNAPSRPSAHTQTHTSHTGTYLPRTCIYTVHTPYIHEHKTPQFMHSHHTHVHVHHVYATPHTHVHATCVDMHVTQNTHSTYRHTIHAHIDICTYTTSTHCTHRHTSHRHTCTLVHHLTRVAVAAALTVGPAVVVRREGDPGDAWLTLRGLCVFLTVLHQERAWEPRVQSQSQGRLLQVPLQGAPAPPPPPRPLRCRGRDSSLCLQPAGVHASLSPLHLRFLPTLRPPSWPTLTWLTHPAALLSLGPVLSLWTAVQGCCC